MNGDILLFFDRRPAALPLYEAFARRVLSQIEDLRVKVQKTQISFSNRRLFACVSFLGVRRAKDRPDPYLVITFGLDRRVDSPRIDAASEPYPNRWTHHVTVTRDEEIDEELLGWLREAWAFNQGKGRRSAP